MLPLLDEDVRACVRVKVDSRRREGRRDSFVVARSISSHSLERKERDIEIYPKSVVSVTRTCGNHMRAYIRAYVRTHVRSPVRALVVKEFLFPSILGSVGLRMLPRIFLPFFSGRFCGYDSRLLKINNFFDMNKIVLMLPIVV